MPPGSLVWPRTTYHLRTIQKWCPGFPTGPVGRDSVHSPCSPTLDRERLGGLTSLWRDEGPGVGGHGWGGVRRAAKSPRLREELPHLAVRPGTGEDLASCPQLASSRAQGRRGRKEGQPGLQQWDRGPGMEPPLLSVWGGCRGKGARRGSRALGPVRWPWQAPYPLRASVSAR